MNHFKEISAELKKAGLDAMLLTSEANRFYASDFHTMAEEDGVVLIAGENCYYITDSRYTEAAENQIKGAKVCRYTNEKRYAAWLRELTAAENVKTLGFEEAAITVKDYNKYTAALPECEFRPASDILGLLRQRKDSAEIASMKAAQAIADLSIAELFAWLKIGVTEKEAGAYLQYLMLKNGADRMSFEPIVASGANGSMPHAVPTDKKIQAGEFVTFDFGCIVNGYCSDTTRTVAMGYVTEEMEKVYNVVLEAQKKGLEAAKGGANGKAVHEAAHAVIREAGYGEYFGHGLGHSLGIEIHEEPRFSPAWDKPVPSGTVISVEPGIYIPGKFGVRIEDVVVLTDDGCEDITRCPKELTILAD